MDFRTLAIRTYGCGRVSVGRGCVSVRLGGYWYGYDFEFWFPYRAKDVI